MSCSLHKCQAWRILFTFVTLGNCGPLVPNVPRCPRVNAHWAQIKSRKKGTISNSKYTNIIRRRELTKVARANTVPCPSRKLEASPLSLLQEIHAAVGATM